MAVGREANTGNQAGKEWSNFERREALRVIGGLAGSVQCARVGERKELGRECWA